MIIPIDWVLIAMLAFLILGLIAGVTLVTPHGHRSYHSRYRDEYGE